MAGFVSSLNALRAGSEVDDLKNSAYCSGEIWLAPWTAVDACIPAGPADEPIGAIGANPDADG